MSDPTAARVLSLRAELRRWKQRRGRHAGIVADSERIIEQIETEIRNIQQATLFD